MTRKKGGERESGTGPSPEGAGNSPGKPPATAAAHPSADLLRELRDYPATCPLRENHSVLHADEAFDTHDERIRALEAELANAKRGLLSLGRNGYMRALEERLGEQFACAERAEARVAELSAELQDWWELSTTSEKTLVAERKLARERED